MLRVIMLSVSYGNCRGANIAVKNHISGIIVGIVRNKLLRFKTWVMISIRNYLQQKEEAQSKVGFGLQ
jgi:hypothetical protein